MAEKKALPLALAAALALSALAGCSDGGGNDAGNASGSSSASGAASAQASAEAPFSYTFLDTVHPTALFGYNNPNDVVTPVVEQKFNVKVSDIVFSAGQSPVERVNMLVAANNLPDVVLVDNPNLSLLYSTGAFADLSEYQSLMVNTDKYVSDTGWNSLKVAGKLVALPTSAMPDAGNPEVAAAMQADIFHRDPVNWAFMLREDILKKLGYKFKTVKDIQAELDQNPRQLTDADLQLDPPIETPEDFEKLLYDIQKLDLKVDGKPVIPLSIPDWGAYHISSLYAPTGGYYANPDTGEVAGFIGNPNMKTYYAKLRQWFKDGVLDKDYLLQKPEQLQQKIASGRVAAMFSVPDTNGARTSLKQLDPEAELRPIPWPKSQYEIDTGHASYVDPSYPAGFYNIMINKNVKDIPRLLKYFDWFQTEEAMDLSVWGPESAGLYELKDGVKVFKDQALYEAIRDGKKDRGRQKRGVLRHFR
ncbi:extracellular solute-binding protein [Cohnella rhizosphaerae]|uniref:Extracellular solute-binding protein n=1 Tax=Cohnella rhizosphaerae TaxID=1457232 RepID=A0A9X4QWC2_9BACL|nr:extracellular solute-binding protein [Cohnella rhizosphaerae]MDG0814316.1 extracellular solute-binding protein [Cohnella rhizosphaerae]